jgi:hypothetical protein
MYLLRNSNDEFNFHLSFEFVLTSRVATGSESDYVYGAKGAVGTVQTPEVVLRLLPSLHTHFPDK